jgi:hypothetical protein
MGSFVTLSVLVGLAWGLALGLAVFIGSFLSDSIGAIMPPGTFGSVPSGVVMLVLIPASFASAGMVLGCISYPFFKGAIHIVSGVNLECEMRSAVETEAEESHPVYAQPVRVTSSPTRARVTETERYHSRAVR